jgi:hypothetical protein
MASSRSRAKLPSSRVEESRVSAAAMISESRRPGPAGTAGRTTATARASLSITTSAPRRTYAISPAKSRAASASEMWIVAIALQIQHQGFFTGIVKPWPTSRYQSAVDECSGDWALADGLREIAGRKPVCTGTDRSLLRSVLGLWSPVPKCEAPGDPFQWKNTLPWHPGPAAKVRILRFKNLPPFRHDRALQNHV